jgi:hypothetical protein
MKRGFYKAMESTDGEQVEELVSPGYLAQKTGLSRYIIRKMCESGQLCAVRGLGGHWRIGLNSAIEAIDKPLSRNDELDANVFVKRARQEKLLANEPILLTPEELSLSLREKLSPKTLVRWARCRKIPAIQCGRNFLFRLEEVLVALSTSNMVRTKKPTKQDDQEKIHEDL